MNCFTALNNTLALRYRGDHNLSAEMLRLFQAGTLVTGMQGLCLPSECTADYLQPVKTTLVRLLLKAPEPAKAPESAAEKGAGECGHTLDLLRGDLEGAGTLASETRPAASPPPPRPAASLAASLRVGLPRPPRLQRVQWMLAERGGDHTPRVGRGRGRPGDIQAAPPPPPPHFHAARTLYDTAVGGGRRAVPRTQGETLR